MFFFTFSTIQGFQDFMLKPDKFRRFLVLKYDCCERSNAKHGSKLARISVDFEVLEVKSD